MAIRAQNTEVLDPVVVGVAIDMVELERNRLPVPFDEPAFFATNLLQSRGDQASLELAARVWRVEREYLLKRSSGHDWPRRALAPALT
jgi:hypothetical protein